MEKGHFYFIKDQYFADFQDKYLMQNKETINGRAHGRPCYFAYLDEKTNLYWAVPISSQVEKYEIYYKNKIKRYGRCDTIVFGEVLGHKKAFLIQNMCPITEDYIEKEYLDHSSNEIPVLLDKRIEIDLEKKVKKVLVLLRRGKSVIYPDVLKIETELLK